MKTVLSVLNKLLTKVTLKSVLAGLCLVSGLAFAGSGGHKAKEDTLEERLAPAGKICMAGDECAAAPVATVASGEPRSGESIYTSKCASCHTTGAAGAPKYGDAGQWAARLEQGMELLYTHAIQGINGMPPKGLCMDCSDDEIKVTVDYMVESVQ